MAKEIEKNCLVMKILTQHTIGIEALRNYLKMLGKPAKGLQVFKIGEEMYLAKFRDGRDKRRILEMCPWSYEKQLILQGERVPKEITIKWNPFWVQIYNLPLKCMTRESSMEIGAKLGKVLGVNMPETGV